jgi:hypothetical protein
VCFFPARTRRPPIGNLLPTFIPTYQPDLVQDILRKPPRNPLQSIPSFPSILWPTYITSTSVFLIGTGLDDLDNHNRLRIRYRPLPQREDPV